MPASCCSTILKKSGLIISIECWAEARTLGGKNPLSMAMTDQRDEEGPPTQLQLAKEHKLRAAKLLSPRKLSFKRARVREAAEEYLKAAEILYQEGQLLDAWLCLQDSFECYNRKQMWFEGARALEQKVVVDYLIRQKGQSQSGGDSGDSEAVGEEAPPGAQVGGRSFQGGFAGFCRNWTWGWPGR